jgi:RTA1 like protein
MVPSALGLCCSHDKSTVLVRQDIIALAVQSVGGGLASGTQTTLGGHIALGGIAIQLSSVSPH